MSCMLCQQTREREGQNIVLLGDVTTLGLIHAHVRRLHREVPDVKNGIFMCDFNNTIFWHLR